jgi:hypothetical protein
MSNPKGSAMSATSTTPTLHRPGGLTSNEPASGRTVRQRAAALASSAVAAILGVLPHVLHHAGPLAGAALLAGTGGTLLFGAIGLIAAVPFLLRVHRRCGNWRIPSALLALFTVVFSISAFVVGPAISGGSDGGRTSSTTQRAPSSPADNGHASHHQ